MTNQTKSPVTAGNGPGLENFTRKNDSTNFAAVAPACGKTAAIALYCHSILSLDRVAAMFARHPEWRPA